MKNIHLKKILLSIFLICTLFFTTMYADGSQNNGNTTDEELENVQNQIEDAEGKMDEYHTQKDALENNLANLNNDLQSLASNMNELETQIAYKQEEIETISAELDAAAERSKNQKEAMMSRIQFMYEQGNTSLLVTLLESKSFSEFLKNAEYIAYITSYDKTKLEEFQQTQREIAEKKETLKSEETSLLSLKDEMKQKQSSVSQLIHNTQSQIASTDHSLAELEQKVKEWEAYEKELERQKAQADLEKWQSIQNSASEDFSHIDYTTQEGEAYLLAAIIQCEAESEPYDGKIAVGNVVMNRVKSSHFPNSITGVIYQKNQFSPVTSGRLAYRLEAGVNDECIRAANEVLNGTHILDALFFRMNDGTISGTIIGNHVFY